MQAFEEQFDREFGPEMQLSPKNIVDPASSDQEHRIETRIIDGVNTL